MFENGPLPYYSVQSFLAPSSASAWSAASFPSVVFSNAATAFVLAHGEEGSRLASELATFASGVSRRLSRKTNLCQKIRATQGAGVMPDGTSRLRLFFPKIRSASIRTMRRISASSHSVRRERWSVRPAFARSQESGLRENCTSHLSEL